MLLGKWEFGLDDLCQPSRLQLPAQLRGPGDLGLCSDHSSVVIRPSLHRGRRGAPGCPGPPALVQSALGLADLPTRLLGPQPPAGAVSVARFGSPASVWASASPPRNSAAWSSWEGWGEGLRAAWCGGGLPALQPKSPTPRDFSILGTTAPSCALLVGWLLISSAQFLHSTSATLSLTSPGASSPLSAPRALPALRAPAILPVTIPSPLPL